MTYTVMKIVFINQILFVDIEYSKGEGAKI